MNGRGTRTMFSFCLNTRSCMRGKSLTSMTTRGANAYDGAIVCALFEFATLPVCCHRIEIGPRRFRLHSLPAVTTINACRLANPVRRRQEQLVDCRCRLRDTRVVFGGELEAMHAMRVRSNLKKAGAA